MKTLIAALTLFAFFGAVSIPPAYAQATGGSTDATKGKKGKMTHAKKTHPKKTHAVKAKKGKAKKAPAASGTSTPENTSTPEK